MSWGRFCQRDRPVNEDGSYDKLSAEPHPDSFHENIQWIISLGNIAFPREIQGRVYKILSVVCLIGYTIKRQIT